MWERPGLGRTRLTFYQTSPDLHSTDNPILLRTSDDLLAHVRRWLLRGSVLGLLVLAGNAALVMVVGP